MAEPPVPLAETDDSAAAAPGDSDETSTVTAAPEVITHEVLVEEVSIDGMCGVY
jgi:mycofactocin precursor